MHLPIVKMSIKRVSGIRLLLDLDSIEDDIKGIWALNNSHHVPVFTATLHGTDTVATDRMPRGQGLIENSEVRQLLGSGNHVAILLSGGVVRVCAVPVLAVLLPRLG